MERNQEEISKVILNYNYINFFFHKASVIQK